MKNLTEYNQFVKLSKNNKVNEEMDIDTGKAGTGTGQKGDMYFANVKGNLAGAENTLVGAATLKLIGFIKRKGLQIYMKRFLKPRLGRAYMNGILRYADKAGIGNFARKKFFKINSIVDKKQVKFEDEVCFVFQETNGLSSFVKGSKVYKQKEIGSNDAGEPLENGEFVLIYNGGTFTCSGGTITNIEEGFSEAVDETKKPQSQGEQEEIDTTVSDDDFEKYRKKIADDLESLKTKGVEPEQWVVDECSQVKSKIDTNVATIDEEDIKLIKNERDNLRKAVEVFDKGLSEINEVLSKGKDNVANYNELVYQKLQTTANQNKLLELAKFLSKLIVGYTAKTQPDKVGEVSKAQPALATEVGKPVESTTESLNEAEQPVVVKDQDLKQQNIAVSNKKESDIKTSRLGDELQEIVASGEAIDLNNENFYKQFEDPKHRNGVTEMILQDKPAIAKIEYAAQRIIAGNDKQQNAWDKMVENVKSMYSKYMDTDKVDPKTIVKGLPPEKGTELKEQGDKEPEGKQVGRMIAMTELDKIALWKSSTSDKVGLGKAGFAENEYLITSLSINKVTTDYIVQRTKNVLEMYCYRVIGKIDLNSIVKDKESYENGTKTDFGESIDVTKFGSIIGPKNVLYNSGKFKAVYLLSKSPLNLGDNADIFILTLYSKEGSGHVNLDKPTAFFTIKKNDKDGGEVELKDSGPLSKKLFGFKMTVYKEGTWKIMYTDKFGIDTTPKWDIASKGSLEKLKSLDTLK